MVGEQRGVRTGKQTRQRQTRAIELGAYESDIVTGTIKFELVGGGGGHFGPGRASSPAVPEISVRWARLRQSSLGGCGNGWKDPVVNANGGLPQRVSMASALSLAAAAARLTARTQSNSRMKRTMSSSSAPGGRTSETVSPKSSSRMLDSGSRHVAASSHHTAVATENEPRANAQAAQRVGSKAVSSNAIQLNAIGAMPPDHQTHLHPMQSGGMRTGRSPSHRMQLVDRMRIELDRRQLSPTRWVKDPQGASKQRVLEE